jgi:hypothetical protein
VATMSDNLREYLPDLFLSNWEGKGSPSLPPGKRDQIQRILENVLVDRENLDAYIAVLQEHDRTQYRHHVPPDDAQLDALLERGLGCLSDAELARLLLNPPALFLVHSELNEFDPARLHDSWLRAIGTAAMEAAATAAPTFAGWVTGEFEQEEVLAPAGRDSRDDQAGTAQGPTRWTFETTARQCRWSRGSAESVGATSILTVQVQRTPAGLVVGTAGLVERGLCSRYQVEWLSPDHQTVYAESETKGPVAQCQLVRTGGGIPQPGDMLTLTICGRPRPNSDEVEFELTIVFPKRSE